MSVAFSKYLVGHTSHGIWDWVGLTGSIMAGAVAIWGGYIALRSYQTSVQNAATAHMHNLFREYLQKKSAHYERVRGATAGSSHDASSISNLVIETSGEASHEVPDPWADLAGYLLYALEEMYAWVLVERRATKSLLSPMLFLRSTQDRLHRQDMVNAWEATIITHLLQEHVFATESLLEYSSCYSTRFLDFAGHHLKDPQLIDLAHASRWAVDHGRRRPLGTVEAAQRRNAQDRFSVTTAFAAALATPQH